MRNSIRFIHIAVMIALAAVVTILPTAAQAQDQWPINFQGILLDVNGDPVTIPISVTFKIWDADVGGNELWSEVQVVTVDSDGRFDVLLGSIVPIPDAALAGGTAYIGTTVDTDPEMSPRAQLVSVGYAHRTRTIDGASGGTISGDIEVQNDLTVSGNIIGSTPWTPFPYAAGYGDYAPAHPGNPWQTGQYRKIGDVVYLRGLMHKDDHSQLIDDIIGTLPPGFRPPARTWFQNSDASSGDGAVLPYINGDVHAFSPPGVDYVKLDGISFSTSP